MKKYELEADLDVMSAVILHSTDLVLTSYFLTDFGYILILSICVVLHVFKITLVFACRTIDY